MDNSTQNGVRVETESEPTLALVWNGGELGLVLAEQLGNQGLKVEKIDPTGVNEGATPRYIFFFLTSSAFTAEWKSMLGQTISTAAKNQSKFFLILDNMPEILVQDVMDEVKNYGWPLVQIELKGRFGPEKEKQSEAMGKIVRTAFSARAESKIVILGRDAGGSDHESANEAREKVEWRNYSKPAKVENVEKRSRGTIFGLLFLILLIPILTVGIPITIGIIGLKEVEKYFLSGKYFEAKIAASGAENRFREAKEIVGVVNHATGLFGFNSQTEKFYDLLQVAELGANTAYRLATVAPTFMAIPKSILGHSEEIDLNQAGKQISVESAVIDRNLGLIEAVWASGNIKFISEVSWLFGVDGKKVETAFEKIGDYRRLIRNGRAVLLVLPEITGNSGRKTYLVVFQNSAELRPTGGFIGSYAIVHFDGGKLLDYKINDIYTADGQLRGRVEPPAEILHFLGQPNWFMRDANFAADFPLTAKRLEWFLEKETGQAVDGVVAVNLGAVQKILKASGGVTISGESEKITAENFFQKAEFASEINFFPGSTQKKDFLGQVGEVLLAQITGEEFSKKWPDLGQGLQQALMEKDLMLYFNSKPIQKVIENASWEGGIKSARCQEKNQICVMVVEANFGANKANYFVKKSLEENFLIDKGGGIVERVTLNIRNESPSDSWPGGTYKNYIRFLAPLGSKLIRMDLGDGRTASVSGILTGQVLAKLPKNQFLVFNNLEGAVIDSVATTSGYASFGILVTTPIQSNSTIKFDVELPNRLDFSKKESKFNVNIIKQPGNNFDALNVSIEFPSFLAAEPEESGGLVPIASEQKLVYNSDLLVDRSFSVNFKRN